MINKILAICLVALSYINASSKLFTEKAEEAEEAEIIHCHNTAANCNNITILRQQHSVQIINANTQELSFVQSITEQNIDQLTSKLRNEGFNISSISLLKLPTNINYEIAAYGWLTESKVCKQ
jgi:hypothetical protein